MWLGLVFAGGAARRMGEDKAALLLGGRTLLERAVATVREAGGEPLVLTPPRPAASLAGARQVDETGGGPPGGALAALARGLREAGPGRLVVALACDLPLVPPALLRALAMRGRDRDAVVPRAGGKLQVLAAAYGPACLPSVERALAAGDLSMHGWLSGVNLEILEGEALAPFGGAQAFLNVNTPADRERAEGLLLSVPRPGAGPVHR